MAYVLTLRLLTFDQAATLIDALTLLLADPATGDARRKDARAMLVEIDRACTRELQGKS